MRLCSYFCESCGGAEGLRNIGGIIFAVSALGDPPQNIQLVETTS